MSNYEAKKKGSRRFALHRSWLAFDLRLWTPSTQLRALSLSKGFDRATGPVAIKNPQKCIEKNLSTGIIHSVSYFVHNSVKIDAEYQE